MREKCILVYCISRPLRRLQQRTCSSCQGSENYSWHFLLSLSGGAPRKPRKRICWRFPSGRARPLRGKRKDEGPPVVASRLLLGPVCLLSLLLHCLRIVSELEAIIVLVPKVAVDALTVIMTIDA